MIIILISSRIVIKSMKIRLITSNKNLNYLIASNQNMSKLLIINLKMNKHLASNPHLIIKKEVNNHL